MKNRFYPNALRWVIGMMTLLAVIAPTGQTAQADTTILATQVLSTGSAHTCALKPDGGVDCWGNNDVGQADDQPGPYTQISAGDWYTCALKPDGGVDCWGSNNYGETENQPGPYTQISAGRSHTCALKPDGGVDCWGNNSAGQAVDQPGPYTRVSAGNAHTCALKPDGGVDCWGSNIYGQAENQPGPYTQVSAGKLNHTCALKPDGSVDCWGSNNYGMSTDQPGPYTQVSAGRFYTCALKPDGSMDCWGLNSFGEALDRPGPYTQLSANTNHTCALKPDGGVDCWGLNSDGEAISQPGPYGEYIPVTDSTPPVITPDITGAKGQNDWYSSDVTLTWTVTDADSAVSSSSGCDSLNITADQQDTAYTCTATSAGGANSATVHIKRDATVPTLSPSVAPNPILLNGSATASPNAEDATSGLASASCAPVITSSVGAYTVTCTATDNAGNTASASAAYTVTYQFIGFTSPVDMNGVLNIAKARQAIPLKWQLLDANGQPVTNLTDVIVTAVSLYCQVGDITNDVEEYATTNSGLQNKGDGYYQWNWKTPSTYASSCKTLKLDLGEGTGNEHIALFQFKK